jgi:RimJ/RimL family protein N-acetyltransferase
MDKTVSFRDFEERDIDFIYTWKNDEQLNSMIVGQYHPFTYEEAKNWVYGCMGEHDTYKFWAVCANDEEQEIVGWTSLSKIDRNNRSAFFYSIVIGNPKYRMGLPWIEIQMFVMEYAFVSLGLHRLEYSCLTEHPSSMTIAPVMFFQPEGVFRQAVYKHNRYYDVAYFGILEDEYFSHRERGDYDFDAIIMRYAALRKKKR